MENKILVYYNGSLVGTIASVNKKYAFQYDKDWLINGFSISPFSLPLKENVFIPTDMTFNGFFGVFADSLPDSWGNLLLDRYLKKKGIKDYDGLFRLSCVGKGGMGALEYIPTNEYKIDETIDFDNFQKESDKILSNDNDVNISLLYKFGGSSNGKDNWLKFNDQNTIKYTTTAASILRIYFYQGNNNAVVTLNGTAITPTSSGTGDMKAYEYAFDAAGEVIISASGNGYIGAFEIDFTSTPTPVVTSTESTDKDVIITFGNDSNIDEVQGVTYTASLRANGSNSQVSGGAITLAVKAGAKVTVYGYGGATGTNDGSYTSYTVTANGTTSDTQNKDYEVTVTADGDVVITAVDNNNYLMSIKVEYPTD